MMIKLKSLIDESRGIPLTMDISTIRMIRTEYNTAIKKFREKNVIFRGSRIEENYYLTKPSEYYRKSANTNNFYTSLIDVLPSWENWPKRSRSIVCSTSYSLASDYAHRFPHVVFPSNYARIGICSSSDFWTSFPFITNRLGIYMEGFNDVFDALFKKFHQVKPPHEFDNKNIVLFLTELNNLHFNIETFKNIDTSHNYSDVETLKNDLIENFKGDWISYFDELMDPVKNKFILKTIEEYSHIPQKEVWTDADSIMMTTDSRFISKYFSHEELRKI